MIVELSDNFSWAEASHTMHRDIDNEIPPELYGNVKRAARGMERARALLNNNPITISSWYRGVELNKRVGGSLTSAHMHGVGVDFICPKFGTPQEICKHLAKFKELLNFDQLIFEHTWVHLGWTAIPEGIPRLQVLTWLGGKSYANGITDKKGVPL